MALSRSRTKSMADQTMKKNPDPPLSLNQRHNRLLLDLSASHSKLPPSVHPTPSEQLGQTIFKLEIENQRPPVDQENSDDIPRFSGIADFDSPSPVEMKPSKTEIEDCKNVNRDIADKPRKVKVERGGLDRGADDCESRTGDEFNASVVSASIKPEFAEESKPEKFRIEGRRRLCKVSARDDNDEKSNGRTENHDPTSSAIADFHTPPSMKKNGIGSNNGGANEIRDILNDLTSRLEILSMEKRQVPEKVDPREDSSAFPKPEFTNQQEKEEFLDYTSVASSFSCSSNMFSSLPDTTNLSDAGDGDNTSKIKHGWENSLEGGSVDDSFINRVKNDSKRPKNSEAKRFSEKSSSELHTFASSVVELEEDDDDDDCVILSGKCTAKVENQHEKFKQEYDDSEDVDELNNYLDDSVSNNDSSFTLNGPISTYRLPSEIAKMLYPHQRDGLKWLWALHCQGKGGILGDDMGLGKTMQICGFLAGLFHSSLTRRVMVVAPKTLLPHWMKELSVVGLSEKTREYFGACSKARRYELQYILQDKGVLLTTYDIVRNNSKSLRGDHFFHGEDEIRWDYMILDEGHLIKNPGTQRAKSLLEIPAAHRIIISGTPIQNNLKELWALFNFCCPDLLGDKNWFKEKYEYYILRGNEKNASDRDKLIGSTAAKNLREHIQPYFLRRLKNEVFAEDDATNTAKLSRKSEIIVWLRLTSVQRQLYEAFLNSELVLSAFDGSPLAAITILKKICDHPLLLTKRAAEDVLEGMDSMLKPEDHGVAEKMAMHIADVTEKVAFVEKHDNVSCKISFVLSLLGNLIPEGHSVLIFSQTRKMLNLLQESLASNGYEFLRIDGTTKASDRLKIVNDFQEGIGAPIFLLTSQVGGLGLTLTKADRVIVVDPAWNPSTDNQSVDRAYRIGQKKDVLVYRLMTCGTVEEKIYRKQIFKGGLFKTATENKEQIRYFSQQDLRELFSLPKQGFDISLTQQQLHEEHDRQHTMDEFLKTHINFLQTLGIAGVSHHNLLFSKTATVPNIQEVEEMTRVKGTKFARKPYSISSVEPDSNMADFAFNPKDVKNLSKRTYSPNSERLPTEMEIQERINRLYRMFSNKAMISKLPDKGEKIQKQIAELNLELDKMRIAKRDEKDIINLDDITGDLQRVLNV